MVPFYSPLRKPYLCTLYGNFCGGPLQWFRGCLANTRFLGCTSYYANSCCSNKFECNDLAQGSTNFKSLLPSWQLQPRICTTQEHRINIFLASLALHPVDHYVNNVAIKRGGGQERISLSLCYGPCPTLQHAYALIYEIAGNLQAKYEMLKSF